MIFSVFLYTLFMKRKSSNGNDVHVYIYLCFNMASKEFKRNYFHTITQRRPCDTHVCITSRYFLQIPKNVHVKYIKFSYHTFHDTGRTPRMYMHVQKTHLVLFQGPGTQSVLARTTERKRIKFLKK